MNHISSLKNLVTPVPVIELLFLKNLKGSGFMHFSRKKVMNVRPIFYLQWQEKKTVCIWPPRFKKGLYQMFAQFILLLQRNVSNSPDICGVQF